MEVFGWCLGWSSRNSGDVGCEPVCVGYFGDVRTLQVEVKIDVIFGFNLNTFLASFLLQLEDLLQGPKV